MVSLELMWPRRVGREEQNDQSQECKKGHDTDLTETRGLWRTTTNRAQRQSRGLEGTDQLPEVTVTWAKKKRDPVDLQPGTETPGEKPRTRWLHWLSLLFNKEWTPPFTLSQVNWRETSFQLIPGVSSHTKVRPRHTHKNYRPKILWI